MSFPKEQKVNIELTPYDALLIYGFLLEFKEDLSRCKLWAEALKSYEDQLVEKITDEQIDDANAEREMNNLLNRYY